MEKFPLFRLRAPYSTIVYGTHEVPFSFTKLPWYIQVIEFQIFLIGVPALVPIIILIN